MTDKRYLAELDVDELRVLLRDAKRRAVLLEVALQRRVCSHHLVERPVSGPRDNGQHEFVCSKCGSVY